MICRLWRGWATGAGAEAYERIVRAQVIPGIEERRIPGFQSIDLIRRERAGEVEFMTLMWFDGLATVEPFMGADYEKAHVPAAAQAVLSDFEERSAHCEVLDHRQQSH
ncbi:antibiotic biosynthesis monooxygenase [Streptomyces sp. NPDC054833]